jgi:hypothetical protein
MLVPLELMFRVWKKKFDSKRGKNKIIFSSLRGRRILLSQLEGLTRGEVVRMWVRFIFQAKRAILRCRKEVSLTDKSSNEKENKNIG